MLSAKWQKAKYQWLKVIAYPALAEISALAGGAVYFILAFINAHTRTSFLDEGLYLYKGFLFASGKFQPFADFGPWTNHMPLSYLIPGMAQVLFGPGLRTGRYFAIFLALLMLLGLWIVTRRLSNRWLAAGVVWALALNIASIKLYTIAISQIVVAVIFVWTLTLTLGEKRPSWQIALGAVLASALIFVRINMAPVMPLLILYIFWQHGRKQGLIALVAVAIAFLIGNALFWPGILKIWASWLPQSVTPWLDSFRLTNPGERWVTSAAMPDQLERLLYFFLTFRLHFLSLMGALVVGLLWPGGEQHWHSPTQFRTAVFIGTTLLLLLIMHILAAFYLGFCISCILLYVAFFDYLGLILFAVSFSALKRRLRRWREVLNLTIMLVAGLGISYSAFGEISSRLARLTPKIFGVDLQRFPLWPFFQKIGVTRFHTYQILVSLGIGSAIMLAFAWLALRLKKTANQKGNAIYSLSYLILVISLISGLIFSPTTALSKGNDFFSCGWDVLSSYEQTAASLQKEIPANAKVFWIGRLPALMLYLPDISIYPPQLNHFHSFRYGGDDQELFRLGRWNESLAQQWFADADVVLVEDRWLEGWVQDTIESSELEELPSPSPPETCREDSLIRIYLKKWVGKWTYRL